MRMIFAAFTSMACEGVALAFFFWADWKIGVGYLFIVAGEMASREGMASFKAGLQAAMHEVMRNRKDDK